LANIAAVLLVGVVRGFGLAAERLRKYEECRLEVR
jgi:hypothetical protein